LNSAATGASATDYLKSLPLYLLPHHAISRLSYRLTRVATPWFKNALIRWFAANYRVNWSESRYQRAEDFRDFNAFFTRELRAGARSIEGDDRSIVSPADGHISQLGDIDKDSIFQAKGHSYSLTELLGGDAVRASAFHNGSFMTVYLSPRDYHRVHMPLSGRLRETVYIPGRLFSVATHTVKTVPRLFARNERLVTIFDSDAGPMAVILVGAINVAAIETVWSGQETPPHRAAIEVKDLSSRAVSLARGAELGRFNMGSTVIILFGYHAASWLAKYRATQPVRMGQTLGQILTR
jgi:phosphatidylserine decarboxylase